MVKVVLKLKSDFQTNLNQGTYPAVYQFGLVYNIPTSTFSPRTGPRAETYTI